MQKVRRAINETDNDILSKKGVRSRRNEERFLNFIGRNSGRTFKRAVNEAVVQLSAGNPDHASIGDVYASAVYQEPGSLERDYEDVYGPSDWTLAAEDPEVRDALTIIFGDRDYSNLVSSDVVNAAELLSAKSKEAVPNSSSPLERQRAGAAAQGGVNPVRDEEVVGVRGVEEDDAPIDPIA